MIFGWILAGELVICLGIFGKSVVDSMILLVSCGGFAVGLVSSFVSEHGCCGFIIIIIILRQYILAVAIMVGYDCQNSEFHHPLSLSLSLSHRTRGLFLCIPLCGTQPSDDLREENDRPPLLTSGINIHCPTEWSKLAMRIHTQTWWTFDRHLLMFIL